MTAMRTPDYPVNSVFIDRWSPRAYEATPMPETDLLTILEAARWAPSAYNIQPWRFLYSQRDDAHWQKYLTLLDSFNTNWAHHASALIFVMSDTLAPSDGKQPAKLSGTHSFDTGAACAQLALQATMLGYQAHAMAGIYHEKVQEALKIPKHYRVEVALAVGKNTTPDILPKGLQDREEPSQRFSLQNIAFAGNFPQ